MASVSITHLILFIASLLVAASVAGVLTDEVGRLSEAISEQGLDASQEVRTDIEIISDAGSDVYGDENVTLYVKNTGTSDLQSAPTDFDVILDGEYQSGLNVTVMDAESWNPGDVVRVRIYEPDLDTGDHRVKVIVDGDEEVFKFRT
jgi:flagellar protein FlaG